MSDKENRMDAPELTTEPIAPTIFAAPEGYTDEALQNIMQRVRAKRIDANNPIPEPELLIGMDEAPILRRGSLCFVCGQAGSRKTTALTLMCADMMRPGFIKKSPFTIPRPMRILYIDPEQHEGDTQRINQRIKDLIESDARIDTYPLIEFPTDLIPYIIEQLLKSGEYDICVVDNVAQMGKGIIMDIDKAEILVRNLRRLAVVYKCGFFGVIHMNEGAKTNRPRGHGGAEAVREGDLVWQFIEDESKEFSLAEALKARLKKPQKWGIGIDERGLPYYVSDLPKPKATPKAENPDTYAAIVANMPLTGIKRNELERLIKDLPKEKGGGCSLSTASRRVNEAVKAEVIVLKNGLYYVANNAPVEESELPF